MIQLTEYQLDDEVLELYLKLFKSNNISENDFKQLTNPLTCGAEQSKIIILGLFKKELITQEETLQCLNPKERYQRQNTIIINTTPASDNSGKPNFVPYHTICGCTVCNCVMGNRLVDSTMNFKTTSTSGNTTY